MQYGENRCVRCRIRPPHQSYPIFRQKTVSLALAVVFAGLLFGFSVPGRAAGSPDDSVSALRDYVQSIAAAELNLVTVSKSTNAATDQSNDPYVELRGFVRAISDEPSQKNAVRLAAAHNVVDGLRELFGNHNAPTPTKKDDRTSPPKQHKSSVPASYIGTKVCLGCHTSQATTFQHTLMGRLLKQGKLQCETCHGPGSEHARLGGGRGVGGIISFRKDDLSRSAEENNGICLGCHQRGDRTYWNGSPHETRGLACTNCHTIMKAVSRKHQLKTAFEPETCFQCHKDRRAQMMRSSHMPLREGKVVCSDCHNPHGGFTEALLRTDSINDTCYKCHAEKRGPFLFEHPPVRQNCLNCHDPHGSVNEYLLKISRPRLCAECHTFDHEENIAKGPNVVQAFSRSCQNCHNAIHGTNSPGGALLHR